MGTMHTTCHVEEVERMHHDKCVWAVSTILKGGAKKGLKTIYVESGDKCFNHSYLFISFLFPLSPLLFSYMRPGILSTLLISSSFRIISKIYSLLFCIAVLINSFFTDFN